MKTYGTTPGLVRVIRPDGETYTQTAGRPILKRKKVRNKKVSQKSWFKIALKRYPELQDMYNHMQNL